MKILLISGPEGAPPELKREIEQNGHEIIETADLKDPALRLSDNRPEIIISIAGLPEDELIKSLGAEDLPLITCEVKPDGTRGFELILTIERLRRAFRLDGPDNAWACLISRLAEIMDIGIEKRRASANAELKLLQDLSICISSAEDLKDALTTTLDTFCTFSPCVYGEAWLPTPQGLRLEAYSYCGDRDRAAYELYDLGRSLALKAGEGLPGKAFQSKTPFLIKNISTEDKDIIRGKAALSAGLNSAVCCPVISDGEPIAVLLFFIGRYDRMTDSLIDTINAATAQLGPLIRHKMVMDEKQKHLRKYADIINNLSVGIFSATHEAVITEANPAFISILGGASKGDLISRPLTDFFIDKSLPGALKERLSENGFFKDEVVEMSTIKGRRFTASLSAFASLDPDGASCCNGIIEDITEKKLLEENIQQVQKIESVGRLSGGIAHEFNNILAAIIGYGNLLLMKKGDDGLIREYTGHMLTLSEKAAKLTRSMLAFGKSQIINPVETDVTEIVKKVAEMIGKDNSGTITVNTVLHHSQLIALIDAQQITDVLLSLASNSIDAMPGGGTITIEAAIITLDDAFFSLHGQGRPGPYALVSFNDTGTGMCAATKKNAFEPFFTTKEVNKGTGLGLSMAYGVIKQHNGYIDIQSEPGKGTSVMIYLPLASRMSEAAISPADRRVRVMTGTETVLIAEDQQELRLVTAGILKEFGYTVIEAKDGREAIEKFNANAGIVRLVILDMIMPVMGGASAYREIKKAVPSVEAIFMSGYTSDDLADEGLGDRPAFIQKPFMPGELLTMIRTLLDKS